jgi:hypothetical protein
VPENEMAAIITAEMATIIIVWALRGRTPVGFPTEFRRTGRGRGSSFSISGINFSRAPGPTDGDLDKELIKASHPVAGWGFHYSWRVKLMRALPMAR